ncbi:MAG: VOC family protein [Oscillospiraceae bacterium]|jgi:lactoylglutathione lyase|nr:VOC family protein [Oscillospiraceae bacterium]
MEFTLAHCNINVLDIERSLKFYDEALGMKEQFRFGAPESPFTIAFISDGRSGVQMELTCLNDRKEPYELGDNESHIAFSVADLAAAKAKHAEMGVICFENPQMGIYFIEDPDGYWLEIIPQR